MVRPQGKKMLSSSVRFLFYRLFIPLSRQRERAGSRSALHKSERTGCRRAAVRVGMMSDDSPSSQSSPLGGEEVALDSYRN